MKQYELKFYREWYDALAELSREDRAAAALALLEYVYEGSMPDDQYIRIVTTLMRNRIDREKARQESRNSPPSQSQSNDLSSEDNASPCADNASLQADNASPQADNKSPQSDDNSLQSQNDNSEFGLVVEPLGETNPSSPEAIDCIIESHYSPQSESFLRLCSLRNVNPEVAAARARQFLIDWQTHSPDSPLPIPVRIPGRQLSPIDCHSFPKLQRN